jgi:heterodisulfide reductase subunit B
LRYSFYPGCTLRSTGLEYGLSTAAVCRAAGIELLELDDWNCCGASSAHSLDPYLARALPARNVIIAQKAGLDMAIACAACFYNSATADARLRQDETFRQEMEQTFGVEYLGQIRPRNLLDIFGHDLGADNIAALVKKPLKGLKPVSYYGCVLVRPPELTGHWDDPEHPVVMDSLMTAVGAEPVPWSYAVDCCGASLSLNRREVVVRLVGRLLDAAQEAGANCIATACPLCQANLDTRQKGRAEPMPIFYFTELLAVAFGLEEAEAWFKRHLVDPLPLLRRLSLI